MRAHEPLAKLISERLRRKLQGDPSEGKLRKIPREAIPAGTLYSIKQTSLEEEEIDPWEMETGPSKILPSKIGLAVPLTRIDGEIQATIEFDVWRRSQEEKQTWERPTTEDQPGLTDTPRLVTASTQVNLQDVQAAQYALEAQLNEQLHALAKVSTHGDPEPVAPNWKARVDLQIKQVRGKRAPFEFRIALINESDFPKLAARQHIAEHFTRPKITLNLENAKDVISEEVAKDSRLEQNRKRPTRAFGRGLNCPAYTNSTEFTVETQVIPRSRHVAVDPFEEVRGTTVTELLETPYEALTHFIEGIRTRGTSEWNNLRPEVQPQEVKSFERDEMRFHQEIKQMEEAKQLIKTDPIVKAAWTCLFETFQSINESRKQAENIKRPAIEKLRPFQLAYLLTAIPDILKRAHARVTRNNQLILESDLIFFPTGGGKTEAFQMAAIFNAFIDRQTGKNQGITAWLRFALRALTIDQTNRLLEVIYHAEQIRSKKEVGTEPFKLGLFVGGTYTPIEIKASDGNQLKRLDEIQSQLQANPKHYAHVSQCPQCYDSSIINEFDEDEWKMKSICSNHDCKASELPILIVDDEMKRRPPAFMVGTIDKITGVGLARRFQPLLRSPEYICPVHGASAPAKGPTPKCSLTTASTKPCGQSMTPFGEPEDWGPSLIILDEVHLLEEELAAFTAQYEATLKEIQISSGFPAPKAILASATVAGYQKHVQQLTGNQVRLFPGPPPRPDKGIWYRENPRETQRFVIGTRPNGQTSEQMMMDILYNLLVIRATSLDPSSPWCMDKHLDPADFGFTCWSPKTRLAAWKPFWTHYIYVLAKHAGESIKQSSEEQLRANLISSGFPEPVVQGLISSDLSPGELSEVLETLMNQTNAIPPDIVPITDALTEGWDNKLCNIFILNGQPRKVTKDIQGTGRAGRSYAGLVIRSFHPIKERDRNHYEFFHHYEENRDILIEPSRINRHALRSVERTLPGILMALLFNTREDRLNQHIAHFSDSAEKIIANAITRKSIKESIQRIYDTNAPDKETFATAVETNLEIFFSAISTPSATQNFTSQRFPRNPMTSLRDVDPGIPFFVDKQNTEDWVRKKFRLGTNIRRSRSQVLFRHLPGSIYDYQGETLVQTMKIGQDRFDNTTGSINVHAVLPRLRPLLMQDETFASFAHRKNGDELMLRNIEFIRPGHVSFTLYPLTFECRTKGCGTVWKNFPSALKQSCPTCKTEVSSKTVTQLPYVLAHETGKIRDLATPRCKTCNEFTSHELLRSHSSDPRAWIWKCKVCDSETKLDAMRPLP